MELPEVGGHVASLLLIQKHYKSQLTKINPQDNEEMNGKMQFAWIKPAI